MSETLSFFATKLFWMVLAPSHLLVLMLLAGFLIKRGALRAFLHGFAMLAILLCLMLPIGNWALIPLEQCFARMPEITRHNGYVVLGGAMVASTQRVATFNGSADRVMNTIKILNNDETVPVIYTGGSGSIFDTKFDEAGTVKKYFEEVGIKTGRMMTESASRNTFENAVNTVDLIEAQGGGNWVLMTSAFHLPRAYSLFEKAGKAKGITFLPYPVDYKTDGIIMFEFQFNLTDSLGKLDLATKEYLGLFLNKITGKADTYWPCGQEKKGLL